MKVHNTLTRQLEDFIPIRDKQVKFYSCGPTVYDSQQLGNLRTFVFYDTLRRALENSGFKVSHVMNITDVGHLVSDADEGEDKLEKGAEREGKTVREVAQHYIDAFKHDLSRLNITPPNGYGGKNDPYARATDFIDEQITIISTLLDKGFAYVTKQAIYFDVTKLPSYGELTGQKLSEKETAARPDVVIDKDKHHPYDFAVWFFTVGHFSGHSMRWPSPWGEGFPGWHLECSAIIHSTLGDPIDVHAGGVDLIGTHHTNEMAQTEAAFGHKLAKYWIHGEHLLIDGRRMGKSLGNFFTLDDVVKRGYDPLALRLLYLQAHYRSQMNFTWESLDGAQANLASLRAWADLIHQAQPKSKPGLLDEVEVAVENDLNTPQALAALSNYQAAGAPDEKILKNLDALFGLGLSGQHDISNQQKQLLQERQTARHSKDWAKSDELREKLREQGIEINDTDNGPIWSRIN